nr:MAG TPA: hypothetical protein [Caudoviricetes sp.]
MLFQLFLLTFVRCNVIANVFRVQRYTKTFVLPNKFVCFFRFRVLISLN